MTVLVSRLLPLGLFLCLGLPFSSVNSASTSANSTNTSANSTSTKNDCEIFNELYTINGPAIKTDKTAYKRNRLYKVTLPVNVNATSVILRAVDKDFNIVGTWKDASPQATLECKGGAVYNTTALNSTFLKAQWRSPSPSNITAIELQAITVYRNQNATYSSLKLNEVVKITTLTFNKKSTSHSTAQTPTKTRSLANKIYRCPITDAIQILIVLLISRLIF